MVFRIHAVRVRLVQAAIVLLAITVVGSGLARAQDLAGLTGVWRGTEVTPVGPSAVEAIFFPNGTYSRTHVLGTLRTHDSGHYEVVRNWVHFYLRDWGPTHYLGRPLSWPTSDTWIVTRFDGRTLETANIRLRRIQ